MSFPAGVLSSAADRLIAPPDPFWDRPDLWGRSHFDNLWSPAWYQEKIAVELAKYRKVSVIGPHGMGKSATDALVAFWFAMTRERAGIDWKVITTAGAWRQLQRYLWPEIHKWSHRLITPLRRDELLTQEVKLRYGQIFPVTSDDPANIEGAHATEILYIIDEAKNVPPGSWDAIEGALSAGNAYCLANSTPGKAEGRLWEIHDHRAGLEDWHTIHVTLEDAIGAGRINRDWAEARRRQWGETSPVYKNRVLGEFSATDSDGVLPLDWVDDAIERWKDKYGDGGVRWRAPGALTAISGDVASELGVDKTEIGRLYKHTIVGPLIDLPKVDTMATADKVMEILQGSVILKSLKEQPIVVIDAIGVGTGVVDNLRARKVVVDAYMGSQKSTGSDFTKELTFINRRAESWWHMRDLVNPAFDSDPIYLPDDPELLGDLVAPQWEETPGGKIKIEDKDDIIKRLGRSPDKGDAVVMLFNARRKRSHNLEDTLPVSLQQTSRWTR